MKSAAKASREYVVGIRVGLKYALHIIQTEEEGKKVRRIRDAIQKQIDELTADLEGMSDE